MAGRYFDGMTHTIAALGPQSASLYPGGFFDPAVSNRVWLAPGRIESVYATGTSASGVANNVVVSIYDLMDSQGRPITEDGPLHSYIAASPSAQRSGAQQEQYSLDWTDGNREDAAGSDLGQAAECPLCDCRCDHSYGSGLCGRGRREYHSKTAPERRWGYREVPAWDYLY